MDIYYRRSHNKHVSVNNQGVYEDMDNNILVIWPFKAAFSGKAS